MALESVFLIKVPRWNLFKTEGQKVKKHGTSRKKFARKGRAVEVWCDSKEIAIQVRIEPQTANPSVEAIWQKLGKILTVDEAVGIASELLKAVDRVRNFKRCEVESDASGI
jgi:hypothetical protein